MSSRKKRKPDMRRIRTSQTYSILEIAEALDRNVATVRRWYLAGLPALDDQRPLLFDGAELKSWLQKRWARKKQPTDPNAARCFKCGVQTQFEPGSQTILNQSSTVCRVSGKCIVCGTKMNTFARISEFQRTGPGHTRGTYGT